MLAKQDTPWSRGASIQLQVAPGQHEMSPVFRVANVSCDTNVLFMEVLPLQKSHVFEKVFLAAMTMI